MAQIVMYMLEVWELDDGMEIHFYNGNRILGLTTNSGYTITFNIWGGTPTTVMTIGNIM